jgi:hypothetical protein
MYDPEISHNQVSIGLFQRLFQSFYIFEPIFSPSEDWTCEKQCNQIKLDANNIWLKLDDLVRCKWYIWNSRESHSNFEISS